MCIMVLKKPKTTAKTAKTASKVKATKRTAATKTTASPAKKPKRSASKPPTAKSTTKATSSTKAKKATPKSVAKKRPVSSKKTITSKAKRPKILETGRVTVAPSNKTPAKRKTAAAAADPDSKDAKKSTIKKPAAIQKSRRSTSKVAKDVLPVPVLKTTTGTVFVVGDNDCGQLGKDDGTSCLKIPQELRHNNLTGIVDVVAGGMHSVCLTQDGDVFAFGCNDEGALGRGENSNTPEFEPKKIIIPERIVQVSAGDSHTAALSEDGQVYVWGNFRNNKGKLGMKVFEKPELDPYKLLVGKVVVMIASGSDHLVMLTEDGQAYSCGNGENGQLGRVSVRNADDGGRAGVGLLLNPAIVPVHNRTFRPIIFDRVWAGSTNTFLREKSTGHIYACGLNNDRQLGPNNNIPNNYFAPTHIPAFDNRRWLKFTCGSHHTLALTDDGVVFSFGCKQYGRLGLGLDADGEPVPANGPTAIPTLQAHNCIDVSCGMNTSFAVTDEGMAFSFGTRRSMLGLGIDDDDEDSNDIYVPTHISAASLQNYNVVQVSGGDGLHALFLAREKE